MPAKLCFILLAKKVALKHEKSCQMKVDSVIVQGRRTQHNNTKRLSLERKKNTHDAEYVLVLKKRT